MRPAVEPSLKAWLSMVHWLIDVAFLEAHIRMLVGPMPLESLMFAIDSLARCFSIQREHNAVLNSKPDESRFAYLITRIFVVELQLFSLNGGQPAVDQPDIIHPYSM